MPCSLPMVLQSVWNHLSTISSSDSPWYPDCFSMFTNSSFQSSSKNPFLGFSGLTLRLRTLTIGSSLFLEPFLFFFLIVVFAVFFTFIIRLYFIFTFLSTSCSPFVTKQVNMQSWTVLESMFHRHVRHL